VIPGAGLGTPGAPGAAIGIDIGGSGIKGALVDVRAGRLTTERIRLPSPAPATPAAVAAVVGDLLTRIGSHAAVGITLPAVVRAGIVETAANIHRSWIGVDAVDLFSAIAGRPVTVLNDADAAGMAEIGFGAGRGVGGTVVVVTLGTGIGTAVFADGTLVPNTELGHLPLGAGDAEQWASAAAREREDLSWKKFAKRLEDYLSLLERLLWPQLILLGGGVSKKADEFLGYLSLRTPVLAAELRNDAGIVGAALAGIGTGQPA
jgi:polyphosphate glucokinase